ncbi:MAG: thiosulfate oxidation carrier protein SoxY [Pseudomonadota bacterium]|nr:thiosulfate oxidation carrier protein SoxY [Pseudomonadota bacterium]
MKKGRSIEINRRSALALLGAFGLSVASNRPLFASPEDVEAIISDITSGAGAPMSDFYLDLPEIAENGNQVKVAFEIDSPMTNEDHVTEVYILADGNPAPSVAKFTFSPEMGVCAATTRMRLAKTQDVYVLAAFNDGRFGMAQSTVKVTIGGCGG